MQAPPTAKYPHFTPNLPLPAPRQLHHLQPVPPSWPSGHTSFAHPHASPTLTQPNPQGSPQASPEPFSPAAHSQPPTVPAMSTSTEPNTFPATQLQHPRNPSPCCIPSPSRTQPPSPSQHGPKPAAPARSPQPHSSCTIFGHLPLSLNTCVSSLHASPSPYFSRTLLHSNTTPASSFSPPCISLTLFQPNPPPLQHHASFKLLPIHAYEAPPISISQPPPTRKASPSAANTVPSHRHLFHPQPLKRILSLSRPSPHANPNLLQHHSHRTSFPQPKHTHTSQTEHAHVKPTTLTQTQH